MKKMTLTLIALAMLAGCATSGTIPQDDRSGDSATFTQDYNSVVNATLESMQNLNINVKSTERTDAGTVINFTKSASAWSWGEVGRVAVRPTDTGAIVIVSSAKRHKVQVSGTDQDEFATAIFDGIRGAL